MAALKKCGMCGKLFQDMGTQFCSVCLHDMEDKFIVVRDYLYDNPNASIDEVAEATEVSSKLIVYFLKDGRLRVVNATGLLRCEQCGASIDTGRYCEKCAAKIEERVMRPILANMSRPKPEAPRGPRMHTDH